MVMMMKMRWRRGEQARKPTRRIAVVRKKKEWSLWWMDEALHLHRLLERRAAPYLE